MAPGDNRPAPRHQRAPSLPPLPAGLRIAAVRIETWPLAEPFVISRGRKTTADVVYVEVSDGLHNGRGEAVPYGRYGETCADALRVLQAFAGASLAGAPLSEAIDQLPPGAARNALDLALWDFACKSSGRPAPVLLHRPAPRRHQTCYTLSLDTPDRMAAAASAVPHLGLLKLKLGAPGDVDRMLSVRKARPDARLVADANEGWSPDATPRLLAAAADAGFELVEQPLPAGADDLLATIERPVPVCADESVHVATDLAALKGRYDAINLKLDKTGGLSAALALEAAALAAGFRIMVGSMVATSLAVAPALHLCANADWVDLDGPLLLARDREPGLLIENGWIAPPQAVLWG